MHRLLCTKYQCKVRFFPLPCIVDFLGKLGKAKCFSSIDLATAYHWVRIAKVDIHKTAFLTYEGLYKYVVMLFGLCNAPATFQRLMSLTFANCIYEFVTIYLDNILAYSGTC